MQPRGPHQTPAHPRLSSPTTSLHAAFTPLTPISHWPLSSSCPHVLVSPTCRRVPPMCCRVLVLVLMLVCSLMCSCCFCAHVLARVLACVLMLACSCLCAHVCSVCPVCPVPADCNRIAWHGTHTEGVAGRSGAEHTVHSSVPSVCVLVLWSLCACAYHVLTHVLVLPMCLLMCLLMCLCCLYGTHRPALPMCL